MLVGVLVGVWVLVGVRITAKLEFNVGNWSY